MGEKKTNPVVIDDVSYEFDDLSDDQKKTVNHLIDLDRKINNSTFQLDQLNVGKQAFLTMLRESLSKKEVV